MFDNLEKYANKDHFFFKPHEVLTEVCNAPLDASGVYVIYALAKGRVELVYIGSSGKMRADGRFAHREGGLFDRIVNGKQFGDARKITWPRRMEKEEIEALDVYWYDTFNEEIQDLPSYVEAVIIQRFFEVYGCIPRWNEAF